MWKHQTPGIPDEYFERVEDVPITKEEVRVIQISKARLSRGQIVYDIGCGSGSISIEAAHQIGASGKIFSIDVDQNAIDLTKKNLDKFQISNVDVILGNAIQKINDLPPADAIFIGGTGGETAEIIKLCESKLKQGGRIVIGTILVETLYSVLSTIEKLKFSSIDIIQVTISKSRKTSTGTMFLARNPVTIISATKI
ncbi:MAG: precorrin-6Y C5,15-methyltransferase (decarboxylating) subunit CbiT [Thaumarchaeota archaeon]|nr:precorrin-6Y C5,15-methyltransferase (decarboxylating) subunit CbiT [Nitrososphaerota archaeon]MDE1842469.1 precorrin-6Y C5,15-methyltransferase (decarboxylating) subunit CbiT [Nitrososphaerota archaeon]